MTAAQTDHQPTAPPPAAGWDTEVFVLRGDDVPALRNRALALADFVERRPGVALAGLAATLAAGLAPGGACLAVVSGTAADLVAKLRRAAGRLADASCQHIRDSGGVYYAARPYGAEGTVALLFPGEGAQYLNMLADLCGVFPEVEETFAWCDQLAADAGRPDESLRRMLHLPADATPETRGAAEARLRELGPSIFTVLLADQAIFRVLQNLEVPVSAVAGHSAGELAALLTCGAMRAQENHGSRLAEIMDIMQRLESQAGGPDVALLAVGAGKAVITETAAAVGGGAVVVAMDNCPHQCVAVGPTPAVAAVEKALADRGVICERLPFRRPYHTPLFEPYMGSLRHLFADVPFGPPAVPVYCCSTGEPFPADPEAVRDLTVNHWVNPVEFTRMIERMHADGVRLFVEAGPRGNLSAFTEDILRGKAFAAIPANVPRKSGPTQINHLVAQLVAHHVPLNLSHLYAGRPAEPVEWERNALAPHFVPRDGTADAVPVSSGAGESAPASVALMHGYLDVMEQFLDVQREVMGAFLAGGPAAVTLPPPADWLPPAAEPAAPPPAACLVGTIEHFEAGRGVVFRRVLDEREDLYADDHTLGGRGVSRADPRQNGLPVMPMTFSLEAMGEAAALLAPGKVVVGIRDIRLYRWLPFDPAPTTLEVRAAVAAVDAATGTVEVKADVRDLGNSFLADGAGKAACEAVVILADRYPEPPAPLPFTLTDEQPCRSTVDDLRRNMFHGPLFQMIRSLGRCGREGIEGTLEVQPRDAWFRSNPDPHVVIDPVLVDSAMHLLGAWHLEQPDWSGRILLPIGVRRLDFYGPIPAVGSHLTVRGHNEEESARQVRHGLELFAPDGRLWLRMTGAGYWRFYLPFGEVNFFGPKDQYFLSTRVEDAEPGGGRCYFLDPPLDLQQPVLRASGVRVSMTPREIAEYTAWTGTDAERSDWFFGRLVAKDAARAVWCDRHDGGMYPADMESEFIDGRVVCRHRSDTAAGTFPPVAVAVVGGKVASFAAFADRVGVGLELLQKNATPDYEAAARGRAACRAVADALRVDCAALTVTSHDSATGVVVVGVPPGAAAGYDTGMAGVRVRTARRKDVVIATTTCEAGGE